MTLNNLLSMYLILQIGKDCGFFVSQDTDSSCFAVKVPCDMQNVVFPEILPEKMLCESNFGMQGIMGIFRKCS